MTLDKTEAKPGPKQKKKITKRFTGECLRRQGGSASQSRTIIGMQRPQVATHLQRFPAGGAPLAQFKPPPPPPIRNPQIAPEITVSCSGTGLSSACPPRKERLLAGSSTISAKILRLESRSTTAFSLRCRRSRLPANQRARSDGRRWHSGRFGATGRGSHTSFSHDGPSRERRILPCRWRNTIIGTSTPPLPVQGRGRFVWFFTL